MRDLHGITSRFILPVFLASLLGACQRPDQKKLADVNGSVISAEEVDRAAGRSLFQHYQQIYVLQRQKLDELIDDRLMSEEAKRLGISIERLLEQEVNAKILPVSDDDIVNLYEANKSRIPVELVKVQDQIRDLLKNQRLASQKAIFIRSLRDKAKIITYLKAPVIYRVKLNVADAPAKGPTSAQVTIVKFEDFQCPYCKTAQPTFKDLLKKYNGRIRVVHKDLPLQEIHPQASKAAEAARCAAEQGKFWEYHDQLYSVSPNLSSDDLKNSAKQVGLNTAAFDQCLASGKYQALVHKDLNEGAKLGLTGTPTFFINGREMSGALPVEEFSRVIDEELGQGK